MNFDVFKGAEWFDPNYEIVLGGVGGIGSWTNLLLSRNGYTIYVFDFDTFEESNAGGQFFPLNKVGSDKERVAVNMAELFSQNHNVTAMGKYTEDSPTGNIVISAFDNMEARKIMFEKWVAYQFSKETRDPNEVNIFIDPRLTAEVGMVYFIKSKSDVERYRKELFSSDEVEKLPCTYRATSHSSAFIASLIVAGLVNHITNKKIGMKVRDVPFKVEYALPTLTFDVLS